MTIEAASNQVDMRIARTRRLLALSIVVVAAAVLAAIILGLAPVVPSAQAAPLQGIRVPRWFVGMRGG